MAPPSSPARSLFVLSRSRNGESGTPPRALALSLLALLAAVVAPILGGEEWGRTSGLVWILALLPCFLLSFYRGWRGAALALALGMVAMTTAEVVAPILLGWDVDWWIFGVAAVTLIVMSTGLGITTEMLQRAGGDPHLAERRLRTARELRRALDRDEFVLYYQPVVELASGRLVSAEALLRWEHPEVGTLAPHLFLPTAEATGLMGPIGKWAIRRAARDLARWRARFDLEGSPFRLSVNVAAEQLRDEDAIRGTILEPLRESEVPTDRLEFEVPHGAMVEVAEGLQLLRDAGGAVLVDEFGSEDASLDTLSWVDVDGVKISQELVADVDRNARARATVQSLIDLGHELELVVSAAGVESDAQRRRLEHMGCDRGQGFLFGQALPLDEALTVAAASGTSVTPPPPPGSAPGS